MRREGPLSPRGLILGGAALGALMALAAAVWVGVVRQRDLRAWLPTPPWAALAVGAGAGAGFAAAAWLLFRRTSFLRREVALIDRVLDLDALRPRHVIAIALLAAVPEELLFRGALLPELGALGAALVFGLAHAVSWPYFAYATAAGLLCGLLATWSGGLWSPIAAHAAIDLLMLTWLIRARPPGGWGTAPAT